MFSKEKISFEGAGEVVNGKVLVFSIYIVYTPCTWYYCVTELFPQEYTLPGEKGKEQKEI